MEFSPSGELSLVIMDEGGELATSYQNVVVPASVGDTAEGDECDWLHLREPGLGRVYRGRR